MFGSPVVSISVPISLVSQISSAGPGWLAHVASGRARRSDELVMNRHLHYRLFATCKVPIRTV